MGIGDEAMHVHRRWLRHTTWIVALCLARLEQVRMSQERFDRQTHTLTTIPDCAESSMVT